MNVVNHPKVAVLRLIIAVSACAAFLVSQPSRAQQQQNFQQPSAVNPVQWNSGPTTATFNDIGEIKIPDGYQFLDAKGGRFFLEGMHNVAPKNLVGIFAPNSARWYAVIAYTALGYVKDTDAAQMDAAAILERFRGLAANQNSPVTSMDWEIKPTYDASQNKLEWALRGMTANSAVVNYAVRLFGRRGVMEIIVVQPQADFDATPLREVVKGISFQKGERYSDYQPGDNLAKFTLAQMVTSGPNESASTSRLERIFGKHKTLFIVGLLGALFIVVIGILAIKIFVGRRSYSDSPRQTRTPVVRPQTAPAPVEAAPAAIPSMATAAPVARPVAPAAQRQGQGKTTLRRVADRPNRLPKASDRKRRKQYNFHLFYSDMIMNLTRWNYLGGFGGYASDYSHGLNGASAENDQMLDANTPTGNGANGNHVANGSAHQPVPGGNVALSPDAAKIIALEAAKLIENQQKLIEGQRKLIEEQNKLIQEKSKLIDFESSVLGKQSELVEEQGLL